FSFAATSTPSCARACHPCSSFPVSPPWIRRSTGLSRSRSTWRRTTTGRAMTARVRWTGTRPCASHVPTSGSGRRSPTLMSVRTGLRETSSVNASPGRRPPHPDGLRWFDNTAPAPRLDARYMTHTRQIIACCIALLCSFAFAAEEDRDKDDRNDWDVNAPPGDSRQIPIRTSSGTWMSLDVSPDGRTIAFDLLGDIYLLPIEGGDARPID